MSDFFREASVHFTVRKCSSGNMSLLFSLRIRCSSGAREKSLTSGVRAAAVRNVSAYAHGGTADRGVGDAARTHFRDRN